MPKEAGDDSESEQRHAELDRRLFEYERYSSDRGTEALSALRDDQGAAALEERVARLDRYFSAANTDFELLRREVQEFVEESEPAFDAGVPTLVPIDLGDDEETTVQSDSSTGKVLSLGECVPLDIDDSGEEETHDGMEALSAELVRVRSPSSFITIATQ